MKKILSLVISAVMCLSLMPARVMAEEETDIVSEDESKKIQLSVTTYSFVDYGEGSKLYPGLIRASETKGLCSVEIGVEGYAENVCIDVSATGITISGDSDEPHHKAFEIGTLDGTDSRHVTLIGEDGNEKPHLEITVTADKMEEATWSCDFDMETKARAILLADPEGGKEGKEEADDKLFENNLKMMETVFQNCWYNGEPVEIISVWAPEASEDTILGVLPGFESQYLASHYLEDDALGQLASLGIDDNDLTYVYLSAHGLNFEQSTPTETGGVIGDISYKDLIDWLEENVPGQIIIIVDSCYSGALIEEAARQEEALSAGDQQIYDRFVILTAVSPDSSALSWSGDVDLDFERWPGGYGWFTHDIYRVVLDKYIPNSYRNNTSYYEANKREGVFSVQLFYDMIDALSNEYLMFLVDGFDPQVYGQQFTPLFVKNKDTRLAVAPIPVNIRGDAEGQTALLDGDGDVETMLTDYYWYGGVQSPQVYDFSTGSTFVCHEIKPGRSDFSYDCDMVVSPTDFVEDGFTGTWVLDDDTLTLKYDSGGTETYHYYTSEDEGPDDQWPIYFYGEWEATGVLGNTYTEHQTLGRINHK